jgi:hypothetical protein
MFFAFVRRRPLLRALLALVLFAGLLGTAAATHASLTSGHSVLAAVDAAGVDLDDPGLDDAGLDDSVSAEDNAYHDTLDAPAALVVPRALLAASRPVTAHAERLRWHASSELRPPIV